WFSIAVAHDATASTPPTNANTGPVITRVTSTASAINVASPPRINTAPSGDRWPWGWPWRAECVATWLGSDDQNSAHGTSATATMAVAVIDLRAFTWPPRSSVGARPSTRLAAPLRGRGRV